MRNRDNGRYNEGGRGPNRGEGGRGGGGGNLGRFADRDPREAWLGRGGQGGYGGGGQRSFEYDRNRSDDRGSGWTSSDREGYSMQQRGRFEDYPRPHYSEDYQQRDFGQQGMQGWDRDRDDGGIQGYGAQNYGSGSSGMMDDDDMDWRPAGRPMGPMMGQGYGQIGGQMGGARMSGRGGGYGGDASMRGGRGMGGSMGGMGGGNMGGMGGRMREGSFGNSGWGGYGRNDDHSISGRGMFGSDMGFGDQDRGPHYGKGPKGYKRSDERIREEVCDVISRQGHVDASDVEVNVEGGVVRLSGTVTDRQDKRRIETMVENLHGVDDVRNEIRVKREGVSHDTGSMPRGNNDQTTRGQGTKNVHS